MLGERLARRPLALEDGNHGDLRCCFLSDQIVLGSVGLEPLELQLHLIEQAAAALGAGTVLLALQLGDLQLEWVISASMALWWAMASTSLAFASSALRAIVATNALSVSTSSGWDEMAASMNQSDSCAMPYRMGKMQVCSDYPALCGRHVYCGLRQSIPSSRQASCEGGQ